DTLRFLYMYSSRPSSILFPYTTLFRSSHRRPFAIPANIFGGSSNRSGFRWDEQCAVPDPGVAAFRSNQRGGASNLRMIKSYILRSEEHTSELQSRFDLVCRLLLEKRKR